MPSISSRKRGHELTMPLAIIIHGAFIAAAILLSGGIGGGASIKGDTAYNNPPAVSPAPGAPVAQAQPTVGDFKPVDAKDHVRGAKNAKVTILEYSDLECPFCKQFHTTLQEVLKAYPNDVQWVYRHSPLVQLHSKAPAEANAAECAGEQGKFWEFVDLVFSTTAGNNNLDLSTMPALAAQVGVKNATQFADCVSSNKYKDLIDSQVADAQKAGLRGTPYSVIIGPKGEKVPVNGAQQIATLKTTIDSLLK